MRPIAAGEEVTISYVELAATRWERRASLASQYYFDIDAAVPGPVPAAGQGAAAAGQDAEEGQQDRAGAAWAAAVEAAEGQDPEAAWPAVAAPPLQGAEPARVLELDGAVQLRQYCGATPPWPHDPRDGELTTVGWAGGACWVLGGLD